MVSLLFTSCMLFFYWTAQAAPADHLKPVEANQLNIARPPASVLCKDEINKDLRLCQSHQKDQKLMQKITEKYTYMFNKVDPTSIRENGEIKSNTRTNNNSPNHQSSFPNSRTVTNYCDAGYIEAIQWYAYDLNGNSVELVHSPENYLYQTFRIQVCSTATLYDLSCAKENVAYKTLVYSHPTGTETDVRFVNIPAICALMN